MTAKVVAPALHWQALRLWWKGRAAGRPVTRNGVGERKRMGGEKGPRRPNRGWSNER